MGSPKKVSLGVEPLRLYDRGRGHERSIMTAVDAVFLQSGEEWIGLTPRHEEAKHRHFTQLLGHINWHIFAVSDS